MDEKLSTLARGLGFPIAAGVLDGTIVRISKKDLDDCLRTIRELRANYDRTCVALGRIKYKCDSLADAQVIALEALANRPADSAK